MTPADMQAAIASAEGREGKSGAGKQPAAQTAPRTRPTYRPESAGVQQPDLFAAVVVTDPDSLLRRLKQLGADVYCEGRFATLTERLRYVIGRERMATTVSGRNPQGRVETVEQCFERICHESLIHRTKSRRS